MKEDQKVLQNDDQKILQNTDEKPKKTRKQIGAIVAIALLLGLYVAALIAAIVAFATKNEYANRFLYITIAGTAGIPVIIYFIMMFYKLNNRKKAGEEAEEEPQKTYRGTGIRDAANSVAALRTKAVEAAEASETVSKDGKSVSEEASSISEEASSVSESSKN